MNQVVSPYSNKAYFTGSEESCNAYMKQYGLQKGADITSFEVLPFEQNRKLGSFAEQMQILLGSYKPSPNQIDNILEQKINYAFSPEIQNEAKKKILDIITNANEPIKRSDLISSLLRFGYDIPERKVRSIIEELINEDGVAIESSEAGWMLIKNHEQLNDAIRYLRNKAFPLFERANNLKKNFYRDKSIQLTFEEFFKD